MSSNDLKETEIGIIPNDWDVKKIGDIGKVVAGGTPSTKNPEYYGGNISWITPKDLSNYTSKFISKGERSITEEGLKKSSAKLLPKGTVLLSSRAPIGYVAIAENEVSTNQGFKNIICNKDVVNNQFIYYLLKTKKESLESVAGGSTFKEVSAKVVKEFKVGIPPLIEQEAIVELLSSIDNKIENNNKLNNKLEEIIRTLYKQWFIDFQFPNDNDEPYLSNNGKLIDTKYGTIPSNWEVTDFKNILEYVVDNRGKTPPLESQGRKLIENYQIFLDRPFPDFSRASKQKYVSEETYQNWFRKGHPKQWDILFSTVGTLPNWCFVPENPDFCIAQNIVALRADKDNFSPFYLRCFLDTQKFLEQMRGRIIETVQPSIKLADLYTIKVIKPDKRVLTKFDSVVKEIYLLMNQNQKINDYLIEIRDNLLPNLMNGRIRIPITESESRGDKNV